MSDITIHLQDDASGSIVIDGAHESILEPDVASARAAATRRAAPRDRKSTRLNSSHVVESRMPSSA